jgi:beta-mannosidase
VTEASPIHRPLHRPLHEGWSVQSTFGAGVPAEIAASTVPATVPGSVHTDLLAAGLIVDPYLDDHERLVAWIGSTDWRYSTTFDWAPDGRDHADLVFSGLDTVATVRVNGTVVLESKNQHRTYRVPVSTLLVEGRNELSVDFEAPVPYADRMSLELGYRPHVNHHPYNSIRKMACNFGWDWGIDAATVGIWRPVELHSWSTARLAAVRPTATVDGDSGRLVVEAEIDSDVDLDGLTLRVSIDGQVVDAPVSSSLSTAEVSLAEAERWWPAGFGGQRLYDVRVELLTGEAHTAAVLDEWSGRVGFRSIRIDTTPDADGTPLTFIVNDQPIFVRGANWIPDDAFVHRVTRERYVERVAQAKRANINLLRVWGGGIFESDDFFDACDEAGILTWQDFLLACAAYAEEEPMYSEMEGEARDNITRLMPHASLAVWNGGNENAQGFEEWGWKGRLQGKTWGLGYHEGLFPALVAELDPSRDYTPASPWSPGHPELSPNDPDHGSMHNWELWNRADYPHYRDTKPRFVAEFGWQGPPTWSTLVDSISDSPLTPESPGMLVHQKAMSGNDKLTDGLVEHLPFPDDIEDWHWAMSLNQATAVGVGIDHMRSLSPHCQGSIVWQLNDCWPVTSWAAIDGNGRAKPLLYAITHSYADRLVTIQPRGERMAAVIVNDHSEPWHGEIRLARLDFDGVEQASTIQSVDVAARSTATITIPEEVAATRSAQNEVLVATLGGVRGLWFYAEYRESELLEARLVTSAEASATGYRVTVSAETLVRDLALLVDKVDPDAVVDDMIVTLLPGETVVFDVTSAAVFDPARLLDPRVLRSANQLLHSSETSAAETSAAETNGAETNGAETGDLVDQLTEVG